MDLPESANPAAAGTSARYWPIHDHPNLCGYILDKAGTITVRLRIAASTIKGAGSGLFVDEDVAEGQELFHSHPLIVVRNPERAGICDVCFLNNWSNCHKDGRFYKPGEKRVAIAKCNGCKVACYCSKACQKMGWKMYHKLECATLKQKPDLPAIDIALMRILHWLKLGALEPDAIIALTSLETHKEKHCQSDTENQQGPPSFYLSALDAATATKSKCNIDLIHDLYCMLHTNCFAMMAPEKEDNLGTCFDYIISMINHSCNENAHVFFEGNEMRVRALRPLNAGEEVFVCYTEPRADVLRRRDDLKSSFFIDCNCTKCKDEIKDHLKSVGARKKPLEHLRKCQNLLQETETKTAKMFLNIYPREVQVLYRFEQDMLRIKNSAFTNGKWPANIEPMPTCMRSLGVMYHDLKNPLALKFYLLGTLYRRKPSGQLWVLDLFEVIRCLISMAQHPDGSPIWTVQGFLDRQELRDVARGYLQHLCIAAKTTFGLDTKFVSALYKFAAALLECKGDPEVGTAAFKKQYQKSQSRLLDWAGVEEVNAVLLPDDQALTTMLGDVKALISGDN